MTTAAFRIDLETKRIEKGGQDVHLTPTEWHLVEILVRNPGKLVGQRQLLQEVWGPRYEQETNYLRVYMAQIRRKLEPDPARPRLLPHRAGDGISVRAGGCAGRGPDPRLEPCDELDARVDGFALEREHPNTRRAHRTRARLA